MNYVTKEEFVNSALNDVFNDTIYVFTPAGDVIELPVGSTPIDFAYKVHSNVGNHMVSAIVNGTIQSLDSVLKDNDIVKIQTSNNAKPSEEWLKIAQTTQAKQKINFSSLCDLLFPGYYQMLDTNNFVLGLEIFKKYYHPEIVIKKSLSQFITAVDKIAQKLGHKGAGVSLANKIYTLAQKTIPSRPNNQYTQLTAISCVETLILTINTSTTIISEMDKLARKLPEYDVINDIPGCGKKLTARIIAEIGDVRRFKNAGSIIAYAGLDAPPYQSGQFELISRHISKRGNKYLRKTGYEIMKSVKSSCKDDNELKAYIIRKENEGKLKKVAKIAGLNKFLRMYYGIVKKRYKELNIW